MILQKLLHTSVGMKSRPSKRQRMSALGSLAFTMSATFSQSILIYFYPLYIRNHLVAVECGSKSSSTHSRQEKLTHGFGSNHLLDWGWIILGVFCEVSSIKDLIKKVSDDCLKNNLAMEGVTSGLVAGVPATCVPVAGAIWYVHLHDVSSGF